MTNGYVDRISRNGVSGWAADPSDPNRTIELIVLIDNQEYTTVRAQTPREDLAKLGQYGDGRHGFAIEFHPPLSGLLPHEISVRTADGRQPITGGTRTIAALDPANALRIDSLQFSPLTPILVTAMGRSGTTILMNRLSTHHSIVASTLYPSELKLMTYYSSAFRVLTAAGNHSKSSHPDSLATAEHFIGSNPFFNVRYEGAFSTIDKFDHFFQQIAPSKLATCFRDLILAFYSFLAADHGKTNVTFFAEKCDLLETRRLSRVLFPAIKEIVLVRDLRDVYCSFKAFWTVDGPSAFRSILDSSNMILDFRSQNQEDVCFVKYEDLILNTESTLETIGRFVGLADLIQHDPSGTGSLFTRHGTSSNTSRFHWTMAKKSSLRQKSASVIESFTTS